MIGNLSKEQVADIWKPCRWMFHDITDTKKIEGEKRILDY